LKSLIITLLALLCITGLGFAFEDGRDIDTEEETVSICPTTKMAESCTDCHSLPDWSLIEKKPNANRAYPYGPVMNIVEDGKVAYLFITNISSSEIADFFEYLRWHPEVERCVFEIHSPGGSLFEAWRIIGLMELWKANGMIIETRCHGFAASAGFVVFVNGSPGFRFASETAELMWHELYTFKFFSVDRPSDVEDEAVVLRHLQTTANDYLAKRSNLTAEEWNKKIHKKEFWCNGKEALDYGLSDGIPKGN